MSVSILIRFFAAERGGKLGAGPIKVSTAFDDSNNAAYPRASILIQKSIQSDSPTDPERDNASFPVSQNRRGHKRQLPVV